MCFITIKICSSNSLNAIVAIVIVVFFKGCIFPERFTNSQNSGKIKNISKDYLPPFKAVL